MNIIGITIDNELVAMRGGRVVVFCPVSQEQIDERNELDTIRDIYGLEELSDEQIQWEIDHGDGYFFGHDTSYINEIPDWVREHFFEVETFECVACGGDVHRYEFVKTFTDLNQFPKPKPKLTLIQGGAA